MIDVQVLRDAAAEKLKKISSAKIYENTVIENFTAPCFFIEISNLSGSIYTQDLLSFNATIQITYFPPISAGERIRSSKSTFEMMKRIVNEFGVVEFSDRIITAQDVNFSFLGENTDVLQANVVLQFFESAFPDEDEAEEKIIEEVNFS